MRENFNVIISSHGEMSPESRETLFGLMINGQVFDFRDGNPIPPSILNLIGLEDSLEDSFEDISDNDSISLPADPIAVPNVFVPISASDRDPSTNSNNFDSAPVQFSAPIVNTSAVQTIASAPSTGNQSANTTSASLSQTTNSSSTLSGNQPNSIAAGAAVSNLSQSNGLSQSGLVDSSIQSSTLISESLNDNEENLNSNSLVASQASFGHSSAVSFDQNSDGLTQDNQVSNSQENQIVQEAVIMRGAGNPIGEISAPTNRGVLIALENSSTLLNGGFLRPLSAVDRFSLPASPNPAQANNGLTLQDMVLDGPQPENDNEDENTD